MAARDIFISAGDPSGDNASGRMVAELQKLHPDLAFFGLGGLRLKALGQEQAADSADLAVLGFQEVARRFFFFRRLLQECVEQIRTRRPSAVILVDYPGFNLRLAKRIKSLGLPIIYYISPQVWAWGRRRIDLIRACVDRVLVILPFEQAFYRRHNVACDFVGHYLLEDIPPNYLGTAPPGRGQLAVLPGSRRQEVERMLPAMLKAARRFCREDNTRAVVAGVRGACEYERLMENNDDGPVDLVYDDSRRVINESDMVLTASGTATLETGIIGRPMVVVYKTGFFTYQIASRLVHLDSISLVNLVLGEKVVPELIQRRATPEAMYRELKKYSSDPSCRHQVLTRLGQLRGLLGGTGASERTARIISGYL